MREHTKTRIRIRPSGWVFIVISVLVQLAAWNTGTNLLYLVGGVAQSFLAIGFAMSLRSLHGLNVVRDAPAAVHRGDWFTVQVRVDNRRRWLPAASILVMPRGAARGSYVPSIPRGSAAMVHLRDTIPRRGVHPVPPLIVSTGFPLGLFSRELVYDDRSEIVVYPKVISVRTAVLEQIYGYGETPRLRSGDGDEFFSLRDYMPGDDVRKISWRVSARVGHPVVRELDPSTARNVVIGFDTTYVPGLREFAESFEECADLAASLAVSFLNRQYFVALHTPGGRVPLGDGNGHAIKILDALARLYPYDNPIALTEWFAPDLEAGSLGYVMLSPDPGKWGRSSGYGASRVLHPREVARA